LAHVLRFQDLASIFNRFLAVGFAVRTAWPVSLLVLA
jgi:hypothetical protein